jgi:hypothetical protein
MLNWNVCRNLLNEIEGRRTLWSISDRNFEYRSYGVTCITCSVFQLLYSVFEQVV